MYQLIFVFAQHTEQKKIEADFNIHIKNIKINVFWCKI